MTMVRSTLPEPARRIAGDALQESLVDLLGLSLIGKQAHWNIVGPRFRSIHLQLDEVVSTTRSYADQVAERAAALGVSPDGRPETVAARFDLQGPKEGWLRDTESYGCWWGRWRKRSGGCGSGSTRPRRPTRSPRTC